MKYRFIILSYLLLSPIGNSFGQTIYGIEVDIEGAMDRLDTALKLKIEVEDLISALNQIIRELNECGWKKCDQSVLDKSHSGVLAIQDKTDNRINTRIVQIVFTFIILSLVALILPRRIFWRKLIRNIQWDLQKNRRIRWKDE